MIEFLCKRKHSHVFATTGSFIRGHDERKYTDSSVAPSWLVANSTWLVNILQVTEMSHPTEETIGNLGFVGLFGFGVGCFFDAVFWVGFVVVFIIFPSFSCCCLIWIFKFQEIKRAKYISEDQEESSATLVSWPREAIHDPLAHPVRMRDPRSALLSMTWRRGLAEGQQYH